MELKILTWNLGNSIYNKNYSYFNSRNDINLKNLFPLKKKEVIKNIVGQIEILKHERPDIMLFQEITKLQPQNYFLNPFKKIKNEFSNYNYFYVSSVNVLNIINHGKATLTNLNSINTKLSTPFKLNGVLNNFSFGNRTFIKTEFLIENQKLIIFNIHLTAFKRSTETRKLQLEYIFNLANEEYLNGNKVIIAGDFNLDLSSNFNQKNHKSIGSKIPINIFNKINQNKWKVVSPKHPTLRSLKEPYHENSNMFFIDGFLVSNNVEIISIETINSFLYSDHAPVILKIKI